MISLLLLSPSPSTSSLFSAPPSLLPLSSPSSLFSSSLFFSSLSFSFLSFSFLSPSSSSPSYSSSTPLPLLILLFFCPSRVASHSQENKMTLNNLATVFGPNLLRPGGARGAPGAFDVSAMDVISPVNILIFFMTCPEEVYQEPQSFSNTGSGSRNARNSKRSGLLEDSASPPSTSCVQQKHSVI